MTASILNAMAESLFATIECELFDQQPGGRFTSRHEAKLAVFDYLETLSRYAGDPLVGHGRRPGEVAATIGDSGWDSRLSCCAPCDLAGVS
jgi:hypothetical protein